MTQTQSKQNLDPWIIPDDDEGVDYPTGCIDEEAEYYRNYGDQWSDPNGCNRKTCQRDGTIKEEKCPELEVPEGCQVVNGLNFFDLDFPFCCDRVVCPGHPEYVTEEEDWNYYCEDKYCIREVGEQWSDRGVCNLNTCKKYYKIDTQTCPELTVPKGCKLTEDDLSQKFPLCCPKVVCPWDKSTPDSSSTAVEENGQKVSSKSENISTTTETNDNNQDTTTVSTNKRIEANTNVLENQQNIAQVENISATTENNNINKPGTTISTSKEIEASSTKKKGETKVSKDKHKGRDKRTVKSKSNKNISIEKTEKELKKEKTEKKNVKKESKPKTKEKDKTKKKKTSEK